MERARRCVETRPAAVSGSGGHATTFGVACLLVWGFGLSPEEAMPLMMEYSARCEPPWSERELRHKVESALNGLHKEARGYMLAGKDVPRGVFQGPSSSAEAPRKKRASFDLEKLRSVQEPGLKMDMGQWRAWLRARSPMDPVGVGAEAYLDALYRRGEKVLVFGTLRSRGDFGRVIGEGTWRLGKSPDAAPVKCDLPEGSAEGMCFLMQPVDGKWHCKAGSTEMTRRGKRSVTRWPYVLLESDKAPHELWLNALVRARIRIVSIVTSGGRSLHAMVRLDKEHEEELRAELEDPNAREVLETLGCDPGAMHSLVYPRLPGTWREGKMVGRYDAGGKAVLDGRGKVEMVFRPFESGRVMQRLLYFNPDPEVGRAVAEGVVFEHRDAEGASASERRATLSAEGERS